MNVTEVTAIKAFVNLPVKQLMSVTGNKAGKELMKISTGIFHKKNARDESMKLSTCDILPSNFSSSLGHQMGRLKWGKVTVIVVVGQD